MRIFEQIIQELEETKIKFMSAGRLRDAMARCSWDAVVPMAAALGMSVVVDNAMTNFTWDGEVMFVEHPYNALHEIAHFQIAPKSRRNMPDYGLGRGPTSLRGGLRTMSLDTSQQEEEHASILGCAWAAKLGFDWRWNIFDHNWFIDESPREKILFLEENLERVGLMENGEPVLRLSTKGVRLKRYPKVFS